MAFTEVTKFLASIADLQRMRKEAFSEHKKEIEKIDALKIDGVYRPEYVHTLLEKEKKQYELSDSERKEKMKSFMDTLWAEIFQPAEIGSSRFINRLNVINSVGSELSVDDLKGIIGNKEVVLHQKELALLKKACKKQGLDAKPFEQFMFETENYDLSNNSNITHTAEDFLSEWKMTLDSDNNLYFAHIFEKVCKVLQEDIKVAPEDFVFASQAKNTTNVIF